MSQVTDRTVGANPSGFDMRTELNNIIAALESDNSGSSEPLNTVAYMKWLDTSDATYYYYKERNHDNTAWVTLFRYTVATKIMEAVSNGVVLSKTDIASEIHASSLKTTPVNADEIGIWDSVSLTLKKLTWANLKDTLKTYFDTLYQTILVSGTNIKTINSNSILGSGDITITSGISLATANTYDIGVGQTWQNVTASRVLGTTYTNSTGKPIMVVIYGGGASTFNINGTMMFTTPSGSVYLSVIVPNESTYMLSTGGSFTRWVELR